MVLLAIYLNKSVTLRNVNATEIFHLSKGKSTLFWLKTSDTRIEYILQKYTLDKTILENTLSENTLSENTL